MKKNLDNSSTSHLSKNARLLFSNGLKVLTKFVLIFAVWARGSGYLIILWRSRLAGSSRELCWIVRSRVVLSHVGHPAGRVRGRRCTSLLWAGRVLQRLVREPRHPSGTILLAWKTLKKSRLSHYRKTPVQTEDLLLLFWKVLLLPLWPTSEWKGRLRPCGPPGYPPCWGILWACAGWDAYKPPVEGGGPGLEETIPPGFIPWGPRGPEWDRKWVP